MAVSRFVLDHYGPGYEVQLKACRGSSRSCTREERSMMRYWESAVGRTWKMRYPKHRNFRHFVYDAPPDVSLQKNQVQLAKRHRLDSYEIKEVKSFLVSGRSRKYVWSFGRCSHPTDREQDIWLVLGRNEDKWMVPAMEPTTRCAGKG